MSKIYKALARAEAERGSGPSEKRHRPADILVPAIDSHPTAAHVDMPERREEYEKLKVMLTLEAARSELRSVMLVSALSGEGVSTVTLGLAASMADAARQGVLVIDLNSANPSLAERLGLHGGRRSRRVARQGRHPRRGDRGIRRAPPVPARTRPGERRSLPAQLARSLRRADSGNPLGLRSHHLRRRLARDIARLALGGQQGRRGHPHRAGGADGIRKRSGRRRISSARPERICSVSSSIGGATTCPASSRGGSESRGPRRSSMPPGGSRRGPPNLKALDVGEAAGGGVDGVAGLEQHGHRIPGAADELMIGAVGDLHRESCGRQNAPRDPPRRP